MAKETVAVKFVYIPADVYAACHAALRMPTPTP
jgi:hypothetical protein